MTCCTTAGGHHLLPQLLLSLPFLLSWSAYIIAVVISNKTHKRWPIYRTICWSGGVWLAVISVAGPLAERAHADFSVHMLGHLFLGMLVPLLMVLAAPMTLILRSLPVTVAKTFVKILKSWPSRIATHPITASILNIGGLWLLYTTNLYALMHEHMLLHLVVHVHVHVFMAGYLFTVSMIYIDPIFHRKSFMYRTIVFIIALAGHEILSKYIYANPPHGIPPAQAELGGMFMYYGGDLIDIIIIVILCYHWFRATRPRTKLATSK